QLASERGAKVVNMSFGGDHFDALLYKQLRELPEILFVSAAGNDALNIDEYPVSPARFTVDNVYNGTTYPALSNVIAVSALDSAGQLADFSNYGGNMVQLAAPGSAIMSTCIWNDTLYCAYNGTSMAAPFVSGAAALLYSVDN